MVPFQWTFVHFAGDVVINIKCWLTIDGSETWSFWILNLDFQGAVSSLPGRVAKLSPRHGN